MPEQINLRLPQITQSQLINITTVTGMTRTQIIIMAIDHLHKEAMIAERAKEMAEEEAFEKYSLQDMLNGNISAEDLEDRRVTL